MLLMFLVSVINPQQMLCVTQSDGPRAQLLGLRKVSAGAVPTVPRPQEEGGSLMGPGELLSAWVDNDMAVLHGLRSRQFPLLFLCLYHSLA